MAFARTRNLLCAAHSWLPRTDCGILDSLRIAGNLLMPPECVFCGCELPRVTDGGLPLCLFCTAELTRRLRPVCQRCGSPVPPFWVKTEYCPRCSGRKYHFTSTVTIGVYEERLRDAILRMKRADNEPLVRVMARVLANQVASRSKEIGVVDYVVPTPMHWLRRLRRGIHPARILATAVAQRLSVRLAPRLVCCRRRTEKQGTLTPTQRFQNVRNAYQVVSGYHLAGKHVVLVDDVMTTGATLDELARTLQRAGAGRITAAVVARGIGY